MLLKSDSLNLLLKALPLYAEEGALRMKVAENDLVSTVIDTFRGDINSARVMVSMIRRIFEMLCLLDRTELQTDSWAFVSFPASLMARSLVESLATSGQTVFPENFWEQGAHRPESIIEQQRVLLHELESRRGRFHPEGKINPIRVVHVAWGIIKLGSDFLLVHRDDKTREMRNYVMPGGRLNMEDCPRELRSADTLQELFDINSELARKSLFNTLLRELEEELGLLDGTDYSANEITRLKPFIKLEGARNNHAYTAYNFILYSINLTEDGNLKLLDKMANESEYISMFSYSDLEVGRRSDGKTAFIDVLRSNYNSGLPEFLETIPNSSAFLNRYTTATDAIDIPLGIPNTFLKGKTGKEKPISFAFDQAQLDLILFLAWHAKGFAISGLANNVKSLGGGWVKVLSSETIDLIRDVITLTDKAKLPLLYIVADTYVRISFSTDLIYFLGRYFLYRLDAYSETKGKLSVILPEIVTDFAILESVDVDIPVNRNMMRIISSLESNLDPEMDTTILTEDLDRDLRQKIDKFTKPLGLRKFIRKTNGCWSIIPTPIR